MKENKVLYDILTNEHVYSLRKLKMKLEESGLNYSYEEILLLMIDTLYQEMCNFKIEKKYNQKNLFKCFKYLNSRNNYQFISNKELALAKLQKIEQLIQNKIVRKKFNINSICRNNIEFLEKIKTNLEITIIQLRTPINNENDNTDDTEQLLNKLLFDIKNIKYIEELYKTFPELINYKTHCGKYMLDNVITKYIQTLEDDNSSNFDIIYFEKIISIYLDSKNFNVTRSYRDNIVKRFDLVMDYIKSSEKSLGKKKKIRFHIKNIIDKLNNVNTTVDSKFFSNMNYRYNIQDIYGDNYNYTINKKFLRNKPIDLTNLYTFTLDGKDTKSFDDAISFRKYDDFYELDVFITDVSNYVYPETKLDEVAFKKGASIYIPDYVLTMLPHSLTYDQCSLIKNEDRNVVAHRFLFTHDLELLSFEIVPAIIRVDENLSFYDIKNILNSNNLDKIKYYRSILEFSKLIEDSDIFNYKYHIIKSMNKKMNSLPEKDYDSSVNFISSFMILTNYFVSKKFFEYDLPYIYRVNDSKISKKIDPSKMDLSTFVDSLYKPSYYSNRNFGHNGLNLETYGHITIPIRNYAALFNQYLEHKYFVDSEKITDKTVYQDQDRILKIVNYINDRLFYNQEYVEEYTKVYKKNKI